MHTSISSSNLAIWIALITTQGVIGSRIRYGFVRTFLLCEFSLGALSLSFAFTLRPWPYFYSWLAGVLVHEGLIAFLIGSLLNFVRSNALPSRRGTTPVALLVAAAGTGAILPARVTLQQMASLGVLRIILPWDHAFFSACCWIVCLFPLYATCVGATIPKRHALILAGTGIYAAGSTGLVTLYLFRLGSFTHAPDCCYCISLIVWLIAEKRVAVSVANIFPNATRSITRAFTFSRPPRALPGITHHHGQPDPQAPSRCGGTNPRNPKTE
jgi:hypothetical protein